MKKNLQRYLITDPKYYSNDPKIFEEKLRDVLANKKVDMACFRDKVSQNFEQLAVIFVNTCKEFKIKKILLNSNFELAKKLNATGVHLNSKQFDDIQKAKNLGLYTIISCHNYTDIENAQKKHINAISYSPIFQTPNKGVAKGVSKLCEVLRSYEDLDIIALGGITSEIEVNNIAKTKAYGFASIRYFI